jgi:hypothetical protein
MSDIKLTLKHIFFWKRDVTFSRGNYDPILKISLRVGVY